LILSAAALVAAAGVAAGASVGAPARGPSPPTPRVARLERQVARLRVELVNVQALALGAEQEIQASHDAWDRLEARVAALEAGEANEPR
jgi:hypothetical protein